MSILSAIAADDVSDLLDKVAEAYGGSVALEKIVAFREMGQVEPAMPTGSAGALVRTFARPLKLRVEIGETPGAKEVRLLDGSKGWRNGKPVSGPGYDAMVLQARRLDLPFQLLTHKKSVVEKSATEYEGKRVRVLELALTNGLSITARIDPATGRILYSSGLSANGPAGPMSFATAYSDFRSADGFLFAFKEVNFAGTMKTAETSLSKIEVLKAVPKEAFVP